MRNGEDISAFLLSLANHLAGISEIFQRREAIHSFWGMKVHTGQAYIVLTYYTTLVKVETNDHLFIVLLFPLPHGQSKPQALVANMLFPQY